jgi:Flp pilus assembly protein TadG
MTIKRADLSREEGFTLVYMAGVMTVLLLFTGLTVDSGRAYVVKAQLSKAVDGAALAAARNLNSGNPRAEAAQIYRANFPSGYFGTSSSTDPSASGFFSSVAIQSTGVNIVTVSASATLPTTFMRLGNINQVTVSSTGEATRRMVDISLVLDVSSSIGPAWSAVRDAARTFVNSFDQVNDRVALVTYSDGARVLDAMQSSRGFNKSTVMADVPGTLPGGSTAMVEGLYRGWDELRAVPTGSQSGLRVIVLFTDGASNSVPGVYDATGIAKGLRTYDFPQNVGDTNGQTWNSPHITGLYDTQSGANSGGYDFVTAWNSHAPLAGMTRLPARSFHSHGRASTPTSFPLQSSTLRVNGQPQNVVRGLTELDTTVTPNRFPTHVHNINNAARNLVEIIADAARSDTGDYRIRIYTIGMGQLVPLQLGMVPETSASILTRIANDKTSPDYNSGQLEGKYYYAQSAADVGPAFQALQAQIVRLSK